MAKRTAEAEYLYATSRVHARENALLTREKYERLIECADERSCFSALSEYGYSLSSRGNTEDVLETRLADEFADVAKMSPRPEDIGILRVPYDCANLKAAIKREIRPEFSLPELLSPCGNVPADEYERIMRERDFSAFTPSLASAAGEAIEVYSRTRDPQMIDILL
ncbi:MAG: V-type ATPase subunit, partial [Eubacteriales bacterium]